MGIPPRISLLIFQQIYISMMLIHNLKLVSTCPKEVTKTLHVYPAAKTFHFPPLLQCSWVLLIWKSLAYWSLKIWGWQKCIEFNIKINNSWLLYWLYYSYYDLIRSPFTQQLQISTICVRPLPKSRPESPHLLKAIGPPLQCYQSKGIIGGEHHPACCKSSKQRVLVPPFGC